VGVVLVACISCMGGFKLVCVAFITLFLIILFWYSILVGKDHEPTYKVKSFSF